MNSFSCRGNVPGHLLSACSAGTIQSLQTNSLLEWFSSNCTMQGQPNRRSSRITKSLPDPPHLLCHTMTMRTKALAVADYGLRGYCVLRGLVKPETVQALHSQAETADYSTIFNVFPDDVTDSTVPKRNKRNDSRAAGKASDLGGLVVAEITDFLVQQLILGPEHVLAMARGATFLKSPPGCNAQSVHTDFDFCGLQEPDRRSKPSSIMVALQPETRLFLGRSSTECAEVLLGPGDVIVFAGDCLHHGAPNPTEHVNYRLFSYVPTRAFHIPWSFRKCSAAVQQVAEIVDEKEYDQLHRVTNPKDKNFDPSAYNKVIYDARSQNFFKFSIPLWLAGLETVQPYQESPRYASALLPKTGARCPHFDPTKFGSALSALEHRLLNSYRAHCPVCIFEAAKRGRE